MMRVRNLLIHAAAVLTLSACATDQPTDLGGSLLSSGDLVTFEVQLPASAFLVNDTSFSGYAKASVLPYGYVAQQFEGVLDAHLLVRFAVPPTAFAVRNASGTVVTDSAPQYNGGTLVLKFDTTALVTRPMKLRLLHTAEQWDLSATWTNRVDSGTVHLPWSTPGGTTGAQIDTVTWQSGDSVVLNVDSASLALWRDTANATRGALIVAETNNTRVRVLSTVVHVTAHSTIDTDTVLTADLVPVLRTFVTNPSLPATVSGIRLGGVPAWRAVLELRSDLQGITFPCPAGSSTGSSCQITLDSAHVSLAQLLLKPTRPPLGFSPEDTVNVQVNTLAPSTLVPLERSPLGAILAFSDPLKPDLFATPVDTAVVKLDITRFLRHLVNKDANDTQRLPPFLALLQAPEPSLLGLAEFDPNIVLRVVLTSALERQP